MEQTSSPELDSFVESLENINKSNPLTSESSLQKLDEKSFKKIKQLEKQFSRKLSEYNAAYREHSRDMLSTCNTTDLKKIKWCKDAGPWSSDFGCCVMQNKQPCPTGRAVGSIDGYPKCKGGNIGSSSDKLAILNDQLMNLSKTIWNETQKINTTGDAVQQQLDEKRQKINSYIRELGGNQDEYDKLYNSQNTLEGQVIDNKKMINAAQMQYMIWFVSAITLGAIAVNHVFK